MGMAIKFFRSARRHRIGRAHALYVMRTGTVTPVVTKKGEYGVLYTGVDDRGVPLEIIGFVEDGDLYIVHVMPTSFDHQGGDHE
jgi:hypothetical protein